MKHALPAALSLLLGTVLYLLGTGRARAVALVVERTDELQFQALHAGSRRAVQA